MIFARKNFENLYLACIRKVTVLLPSEIPLEEGCTIGVSGEIYRDKDGFSSRGSRPKSHPPGR